MQLSELDYKWFCDLASEILAQDSAKEQASRYAAVLGGRPACDEQGNVVVMDGNMEIARLHPLKFYTGDDDFPVL